jgi:hypothetical protein
MAPLEERQNFTELKEISTYIRKILPLYEFLEGRKEEWLTILWWFLSCLEGRMTHNFCGSFKELFSPHAKKWAITTSPLLNHAYLVCVCQHACMHE